MHVNGGWCTLNIGRGHNVPPGLNDSSGVACLDATMSPWSGSKLRVSPRRRLKRLTHFVRVRGPSSVEKKKNSY